MYCWEIGHYFIVCSNGHKGQAKPEARSERGRLTEERKKKEREREGRY